VKTLRFTKPQVTGNRVAFRWQCDPPVPLLLRDNFSIEYPFSVEDADVPESMWWSVLLGCAFATWNFLEDYTIVCDGGVSCEEREAWSRLADYERWMFQKYSDGTGRHRPFAVEASELAHGAAAPRTEARGAASCLSGGKESLLQAGLLREMGSPMSLVNIISPIPSQRDHESRKRTRIMSQFAGCSWAELVRVRSDVRSTFDNNYPREHGAGVSFNELADSVIYASLALPVAWYHRRESVLLGSEWEVSWLKRQHNLPCPDTYAMYSIPTFAGIDATWRNLYGIGYGSLLFPLTQFCIESLLCTRYKDLLPMQDSCWRTDGIHDYCSQCEKCLRVASMLLAHKVSPTDIAIDLNRLFSPESSIMRVWPPAYDDIVHTLYHDSIRYAASKIDPQWALDLFREGTSLRNGPFRRWRTKRSFLKWRQRTADSTVGHVALPKSDYFKYVPETYRESVRGIVHEVLPDDDTRDFSEPLACIDEAIEYLRAPFSVLTAIRQMG